MNRTPRRDRSIVLLLPSLTMGGTEAQLASLLEASREELARTRVRLLTILPERHPALVERFGALDLRIDTIDRSKMSFPAFFASLVAYLRRERPMILHAFLGGSTGTWGRIAARVAGVPFVVFSDRSLEPSLTRLQRILDPAVRKLTTRFLPNAQATADRLRRQGVPLDRIVLMRNGVDTDRFAPGACSSMRSSLGLPERAVVAGFLGMLRPEKRPELFLDAVRSLPPEDRPDYLLVAGEGRLRPDLERRLEADAWLADRCQLLGVVTNTPAFLASLDFLVLTSDAEGMPNAIMEAMACGVPCVATRVSDVPYLLGEGPFLAPPGDIDGIAQAVRRMTSLTPEERVALGAEGRTRAVEEFAMAVAARRFWSAHEDLLERGVVNA